MGGMTAPPRAVVRAAQALGLDPAGVLRQHPGLAHAVGEACGAVHQVLAALREAYEGLRQRTAST